MTIDERRPTPKEPFYLFPSEADRRAELAARRVAPDLFLAFLEQVRRHPAELTLNDMETKVLVKHRKVLAPVDQRARARKALRFEYKPDRRGYVYGLGSEFDREYAIVRAWVEFDPTKL